jgi:hypothetical protein
MITQSIQRSQESTDFHKLFLLLHESYGLANLLMNQEMNFKLEVIDRDLLDSLRALVFVFHEVLDQEPPEDDLLFLKDYAPQSE